MGRPRLPVCGKCGGEWRLLPSGRRRCPACQYQNSLRGDTTLKLLNRVKHRAKRDGIGFDLVAADVVYPATCPVLGITLVRARGKGPRDDSPSIDRIDNTKPYTKGNVRVISWRANRIKGNSTLAELRAIVAYAESGATP